MFHLIKRLRDCLIGAALAGLLGASLAPAAELLPPAEADLAAGVDILGPSSAGNPAALSTHWFHDHMLDFTATNVYKGNVTMMNYYSALDRGKEDRDDGVNLRLPSGTALPWGNRDYDVNLVIADKAWDKEGQLWFNIFNLDGFICDQLLTNWLWHPYFDVRDRRLLRNPLFPTTGYRST